MLVIAALHAGNVNARVEIALLFPTFIRLCRGLDGHAPARRLVGAWLSEVTGGLGSPHSP